MRGYSITSRGEMLKPFDREGRLPGETVVLRGRVMMINGWLMLAVEVLIGHTV